MKRKTNIQEQLIRVFFPPLIGSLVILGTFILFFKYWYSNIFLLLFLSSMEGCLVSILIYMSILLTNHRVIRKNVKNSKR